MPATRYPRAAQVFPDLPERQPLIQVRGLILHSIVGSGRAAYGKFLNSSNLESTFILELEGPPDQIMEANERADANGAGNVYYASVETADNGDPDNFPWTPSQVEELVLLILWYHEEWDVPLRLITANGEWGFGYHVMAGSYVQPVGCKRGPDHFNWTEVRGKSCPGCIRQWQFHNVVWPEVLRRAGGSMDDMPLNDADKAFHRGETDRLIAVIRETTDKSIRDRGSRLYRIHNTIKAIRDRLGSTPAPDA